MPEINLSGLYQSMQAEMLQALYSGATGFVHPGTKGDDTEANWINWFREYLPSRYNVDKAIVIDSTGKCSDQIDLVIYDAQHSYLVFNHHGSKLIPAESVYAVFEVKQNLNKAHMEYAQMKAESVRSLVRSSAPIQHAGGQYPPKPLHEILAGILTTRSDWSDPIVRNVIEYVNKTDHNKHLDFVCSITNNTFAIDSNIFIGQTTTGSPQIRFCESGDSLVFLLLNLLKRLQDIGTVPAIDYMAYANAINSRYYKKT